MKRFALISVLYLLTIISVHADNFSDTLASAEQGNVDAQLRSQVNRKHQFKADRPI